MRRSIAAAVLIGLLSCCQLSGCAVLQEYAEEQAGETGGEEREPFLTEDGYLAVKARESWAEFYRSRGTEWERSLWQEAVEGVKPYLAKGEFLDPSWVSDADEDFPDSGTAVLDCTRWTPEGNFLFFHIWVKVEPGGKYVCDSDYVKELTAQYAFSEDLVIGHRGHVPPYGAEEAVSVYSGSLLISYGEYRDLHGCMEAFGEAWRKLGEHQEELGLELSQQVRFMESDQGTNLNYFESYYPLHEIEFSAYSEAALRELEAQVDEEQLAFMRRWEPARYEAIQKGEYLPREDYVEPYRIPPYTMCTVYSGLDGWGFPYRETYVDSVRKRDPLYEQYRREVEETAGAPNALESEVWPVYSYLSEDWLRTDFPGRPAYGGGWAVSSNLFTFRFPSDYYYCYHDRVSMDMVIPDTETKPYHPRSWTWDMEVPENREADLGRFYLLMFEKEGEGETDLARLLEMERVRERLKPMLFQEPVWEMSGEFISDYHEFQCALGETGLRNVAVYLPRMREGEEFVFLLVFEDFKDSRSEKDLYKMREQLVSTFVILPFWHECVKGDTLEGISRRYTGSSAYVGELCGNPLNRIENPDLIEVGQRIEIPLHVLLKRETYEIGNE